MAKGGNSQRSNCSRFTKPYDASNSFVKKVALRVSGYIGGLFGSSVKADDSGGKIPFTGADDATLTHSHYDTTDSGKPLGMSRCYDDVGVNNTSGKTLRVGTKRKYVPDLPISPIASTSSLFQSSVNQNYDIQNSEDFITSVAGPSGLQNQKYVQTNSITTSASTNTNIKANGATDNHSDSSESTSGCSSLVPQSDRLSQSAFVSNSRKKILEEKLQYVRQLKQNRASMYLNRSIPVVGDTTGSKRKPSFDVSVYGSPIFIKSSVREKMVNSPFYTGQTSYGGASAYRRTRASLNPQTSGRSTFDRKEGVQIQVKPSHHGSTEDMSNMSHTAKRILEALEQFSTPISDAKRIPVNAGSPPLGRKRTRYGDSVESVASLSTLKTAASVNRGPVISGLNIPTVPDLLKLKRLEKIRDSTAAARQVAVQKKEYSLPTDVKSSKHTGKIITKMKDKEKQVNFERLPEVHLPKIPLPISTLPKFDFKFTPVSTPTVPVDNSVTTKSFKRTTVELSNSTKLSEPNKTFTFSPPISLSAPENIKNSSQKNNFTFSTPLKANSVREKSETSVLSNLSNFMSPEALSKLKRKSVSDKPSSSVGLEPSKELKCGSVMDFLRKTLENKQLKNESLTEKSKPVNDTWECNICLIRNLNDSKNCSGCKAPRNSVPSNKDVNTSTVTTPITSAPIIASNAISGFGNKFKPPSGSWSCKECFVVNNASATKCVACENPKPQSNPVKESVTQAKPPEIVVALESKDKDSNLTDLDDTVNTRKNDGWSNLAPTSSNVVTNAFSSETQNKSPKMSSFSFGPTDNADKPASNLIFGSNLKMPEVVPSSGTGFTFGQSISVNSQTLANTSCPSNVPSKTSPFPKPGFSGKGDQGGVSSNHDVETKNDEKISVLPATNVILTTTTNSVFSSSESEGADKKNGADKPVASFTFGVPNNTSVATTAPAISSSAPNVFTFGIPKSESKPIQFSSGFGQNSSTFTFGNPSSSTTNIFGGFNQPKTGTTFGNANAGFGNSAPKLFGQEGEPGNNDLNKSSPFPKFGFSGNGDQAGVSSDVLNTGTLKNIEKSSDQATTSITLTTTTNSVFSSSESEGADKKNGADKPVASFTFGVPNNTSVATTAPATSSSAPNMFTFGIPKTESKPLQFSSGFGQNSSIFTFGNPSSSTTNIFGGFNQPKTGTTFGNANAGFGNSAPKLFGQEGESGNNDLNKSSPFPKFGFSGNGDQAGITSNIPNADTTKNMEKITDTNTTSTALTTSTNSLFGSSESGRIMGKSTTPFVFGESHNNSAQTNNLAMPSTAPNVFTFGAPKQESKPLQFSSGFGQNSSTFTFGNPNPAPSNIFGSFDQPKTESPFGNTNAPFGNPNPSPFGQNSAPASFGSIAPKFEFGSSSQQTQSTQPFQFGATNPQTMASSAPNQNFSISIPESFNFTRGQTPTFSATPTSTLKGPTRRVARAVRRTQR